jgi:hypothetical protein
MSGSFFICPLLLDFSKQFIKTIGLPISGCPSGLLHWIVVLDRLRLSLSCYFIVDPVGLCDLYPGLILFILDYLINKLMFFSVVMRFPDLLI